MNQEYRHEIINYIKEVDSKIYRKSYIDKYIDPIKHYLTIHKLEDYIDMFHKQNIDIEIIRLMDFEYIKYLIKKKDQLNFLKLKSCIEEFYI